MYTAGGSSALLRGFRLVLTVERLRRYTAEVADELAQAAHRRFSSGDALRVR
jgi:hypothetical protein